jgi:hypothetical protein
MSSSLVRLAALLLVPGALLFAACVPAPQASRDGGQPCTATSECNPSGLTCGPLFLCVTNVCTETRVIRACSDGAYPDGRPAGDCLDYNDCNGPPRCGSVVNCVNFRCEPDADRLEVPCDAGTPDAPDAGDDASDAGGGDDAGADASPD